MKKVKQLLSVLAALVLVVGLSFSNVFAAGTGSITISNAIPDQTYSIYKILDLEYNADNQAYAYKVSPEWQNFFYTTNSEGEKVLTTTAAKYVTSTNEYIQWKTPVAPATEDTMAAEFAKEAISYAKTIDKTASAVAPKATGDQQTSTVSFTDLDLGYYLIDTTTGTLCSLTTTATNATVAEKNELPGVTKKVQEDSNNSWSDKNDADLGQIVQYKTTIQAKAGAENYVLHDKMTGLTFQNDVVVEVEETPLKLGTDYSVKTTELTDNCTFEVIFTKAYLDSITTDTDIVVTYSGKVNSDAVIAGEGNPNTVQLKYGENNDKETNPSTTKTFIWKFDILKYANKDGQEVKLAGAKFVIQNKESKYLLFEEVTVDNQKVYRFTGTTDVKDDATELVSNSEGELFIIGLDADTYTVTETEAPAGYNKLAQPFTVKITSSTDGTDTSKLTYTVAVPNEGEAGYNSSATKGTGDTVKVLNTTGSQLPSTGGMGTTYLYVIGGLLVAGSAVLMIARKRMSAE